jgi:hypothetical protein
MYGARLLVLNWEKDELYYHHPITQEDKMHTKKNITIFDLPSDQVEHKPTPFSEYGVSGVQMSSGIVYDEFLTQLKGVRGRKMYREMMDNNSIIGAVLFVIEMLFRGSMWDIEAVKDPITGESSEEAKQAAEWTKGVLFEDMEMTWDDFLSDVASMFGFGWAYLEIVYKQRKGRTDDIHTSSKFNDGTIGLQKVALRAQESIYKWETDDKNEIIGMYQEDPNKGRIYFIPIEKAMLIRPKRWKNSPEGRSILRNAYRPYYYSTRLEEIEAIGYERNYAGIPMIRIPKKLISSSDPVDIATKEAYVSIGYKLRRNEQSAIVIPSDTFTNEDGQYTTNREVDIKLMGSESTGFSADIDKAVKRHDQKIAISLISDWVTLGMNERGSFAMSRDKTDMFLRAIEGWLETIASHVKRDLITRLWELNGFDMSIMPNVTYGSPAPEEVGDVATALNKLTQSGMEVFPDVRVENIMRNKLGFPEKMEVQEDEI